MLGKKSKKTYTLPHFTDEELGQIMLDDTMGWRIRCGADVYGVEPDAQRHECEACGEKAVYGMQEIVIRGWTK